MLAKVEQKANASPQHLLSNIGELTNLYNDYNTWMTLRSNLDVVYNQADQSLRMILLVGAEVRCHGRTLSRFCASADGRTRSSL